MSVRPSCVPTMVIAVWLALCWTGPVLAANRVIEDVRVSKQGTRSTADVVFACPVRYLAHTPWSTGAEVIVRLSLGPQCSEQFGSGMRSELYQPHGRDLVHMHEVAFNSASATQATLIVRFYRPVRYAISQGATRNVIAIVVEQETLTSVQATPAVVEPDPTPPAASPPAPVRAQAPSPAQELTAEPQPLPDREPLRLVPAPERSTTRFVVQLATYPSDAPVEPGSVDRFEGHTVYVNTVNVGGRSWQELRVGFFETEREARVALNNLVDEFPGAGIAVVETDEQARARASPLELTSTETPMAAPEAATLSADRVAELMVEAREAFLGKNYNRSVQIYSRLLEEPDTGHRPEARELLGVTRERKGQLAQAKHEYEAYLQEFPDGEGAQRVRQRLGGLVSVRETPLRTRPRPQASANLGWEVDGGVSQYYRRDVSQWREDEEAIVTQSALLSHGDLTARRRGQRFDLLARLNAAYHYDLLGEDRHAVDQGLVHNAYLDITDQTLDLRARLGRQSLYEGGVLGRFDGAHVNYQWRPKLGINVTAGFPVDSPRYAISTHRRFIGLSVDLDDVRGAWDLSVFTNLQRVDGIADRESVGGEAHYRNERWNLVGAVDLDLSYEVLNSALFRGNWRVTDRITLNGRFDARASPFLTTHNALIGQPVNSIETLLETFTEPQIRRLARDRTAQARTGSVGVSMPISERFHLNSDITYAEIDETVASGGVAAIPASGGQLHYSASFIGSSLFKVGDSATFALQHSDSGRTTLTKLIFDLRSPLGSRLRISPRLALAWRENLTDGSEQWIAEPMLRFILRWGQRHRFEAELGGRWSNRKLPLLDPMRPEESQDSASHFVNVGYWMEF